MASFAHLGKALKDLLSAKSLATVVVRHGSGSRGRDVTLTAKSLRSDMIGCSSSSTGEGTVPLTSSGRHLRFLPFTSTARNVDTASAVVSKQYNELAAAPGINSSSAEKVGQGLLYGRRRKRSSETIRHDKLYLQTSDVSKREYAQTWNDFQDKRSIPNTEWGKHLSADD